MANQSEQKEPLSLKRVKDYLKQTNIYLRTGLYARNKFRKHGRGVVYIQLEGPFRTEKKEYHTLQSASLPDSDGRYFTSMYGKGNFTSRKESEEKLIQTLSNYDPNEQLVIMARIVLSNGQVAWQCLKVKNPQNMTQENDLNYSNSDDDGDW